MQALIAKDVIGDFREPDIMRFGFSPLYTRYQDIFEAAETLRQVMDSDVHRKPEFQTRKRVT